VVCTGGLRCGLPPGLRGGLRGSLHRKPAVCDGLRPVCGLRDLNDIYNPNLKIGIRCITNLDS
jgi:hypothetical protein